MANFKPLFAAAALALLMCGPSFAAKPDIPPGQGKKIGRAAPGPVAGVGLPVAVAYGGYVLYRRRKARKNRTE